MVSFNHLGFQFRNCERQVLVCVSSDPLCCLIFDRSMVLRTLLLYGIKEFEPLHLCDSFYYHLIISLDPFDINNYIQPELKILSLELCKATK